MSLKQILLAIDRTQNADQIFEQSIDIADKHNAHLTLMHCVADANLFAMAASMPFAGAGYSPPSAILPVAAAPAEASYSPDYSEEFTFSESLDLQIKATQEWLEQYQQKAYDIGYQDVSYATRVGKPSDCICELAAELAADLIILGRQDHSSLEELVLGSVSRDVLHRAPCSVLVIKS